MASIDHLFKYAPKEVGKTVRLPIDPVDRSKIGNPNLLGVIMEVDNGFYKTGTKNGVLLQRLTHNQLEPSDNDFIAIEDVSDVETSFGVAIGAYSMTVTHGEFFCCLSCQFMT